MYLSRVSAFALVAVLAAAAGLHRADAQAKPELPASARQALATVQHFIAAFNRGDTKAAIATCAPRASIIDEFPAA